jgi:hypothetical protein
VGTAQQGMRPKRWKGFDHKYCTPRTFADGILFYTEARAYFDL